MILDKSEGVSSDTLPGTAGCPSLSPAMPVKVQAVASQEIGDTSKMESRLICCPQKPTVVAQ